jgi:hypothetical protein
MRVIRIEESKVDKMSDYAEKMLKYGGKIMQCLEELSDGEMGERDDDDDEEEDFGMRGGMGMRGGRMGERRMRGRSGRYM